MLYRILLEIDGSNSKELLSDLSVEAVGTSICCLSVCVCGDDVGDEATDMEGAGEQQEKREKEKSYCGKDLFWTKDVWQLQASQALRQQRSP